MTTTEAGVLVAGIGLALAGCAGNGAAGEPTYHEVRPTQTGSRLPARTGHGTTSTMSTDDLRDMQLPSQSQRTGN